VFELHPKLKSDTTTVSENEKYLLLLAQDARFPWLILVPKHENISEIYQLPEDDQREVAETSVALGRDLMKIFGGDKLNVASLGNQVPQLHIHHIVRYQGDAAWPNPIWGHAESKPYSTERLNERLELIRSGLSFCKT